MRNSFLETAYGQALQYRKRRGRQFEIWWEGSLQTKRARDSESNLSFQEHVRKTMVSMGRKGPYKGHCFWSCSSFPQRRRRRPSKI
jgi:hypothetical protein